MTLRRALRLARHPVQALRAYRVGAYLMVDHHTDQDGWTHWTSTPGDVITVSGPHRDDQPPEPGPSEAGGDP